ncbi:MAG: hypothetical protein ABFC28_10125 [Rikenellaceae bacterium]
MPFIQDLLNYSSVSIVGLEKNTGKTECLNYLIKRVPLERVKVAISSIGIDGERIDQITKTAKPEIILKEGMLFATSEKHYKKREILSEVLDISEESGSLGRIVTARALTQGKVLLSGPSTTAGLKRWMDDVYKKYKVDLCIVDGALSRMSIASPTISRSMILTTGAALSANINTLVNKSAYVVELIKLPLTKNISIEYLKTLERGIWRIGEEGDLNELNISSAMEIKKIDEDVLKEAKALYISGALTDRFLNLVREEAIANDAEIIVRDFSKIFVPQNSFRIFTKRGGRIGVLLRSNLVAVCVNPLAPNGVMLNSDKLCHELETVIGLPVYDIMKNSYEA